MLLSAVWPGKWAPTLLPILVARVALWPGGWCPPSLLAWDPKDVLPTVLQCCEGETDLIMSHLMAADRQRLCTFGSSLADGHGKGC